MHRSTMTCRADWVGGLLNAAHIKLKLVAVDKSEGLARLLNDVVVTQGPVAMTTSAPHVDTPPHVAAAAPEPAPDAGPADAGTEEGA